MDNENALEPWCAIVRSAHARSPISGELRLRARGLAEARADRQHQDVTVWAPMGLAPVRGTPVEFRGTWRHHERFGWQFNARSYRVLESVARDQVPVLLQMLSGGVSLDLYPADAYTLRGLCARAGERSALGAALRDVLTYVYREARWQQWPLSDAERVGLARHFGQHVLEALHEDPFVALAHLERPDPSGWRERLLTAGIEAAQDEDAWLRGWVAHAVMEELRETGSTRTAEGRVMQRVLSATHLAPGRMRERLARAPANSALIRLEGQGRVEWTVRPFVEAEQRLVKRVAQLIARGPAPLDLPDPSATHPALPCVRRLTAGQQEAARTLLSHPISALIGGPGTGKTFTVRGVLEWLRGADPRQRIRCCAPTGKAASRLSEVTGEEASTIQRMLARAQNGAIDADTVVVDEMSMPDMGLVERLTGQLPDGARLILVGDINQIDPIGAGHPFADLIASNTIAVAELTEPHRAALQSAIVRNAYRILAGLEPEEGEDYVLVRSWEPDRELRDYTVNVVVPKALSMVSSPAELQVVVPNYDGPVGAIELNRVLQPLLNPAFDHRRVVQNGPWRFAVGDRVLQTVPDQKRDVFNGETGTVTAVIPPRGEVRVRFGAREISYSGPRLHQLALAYALTIHKAQGSEYEVVIQLASPQAGRLLSRELLMTGITRGRKMVFDMVHPDALACALARPVSRHRITGLAQLLRATLDHPVRRPCPSTGVGARP